MRTGTWAFLTAVLLVVTGAVGWTVLRAEEPTPPDWVAEAEGTTTTATPRTPSAKARYVATANSLCTEAKVGFAIDMELPGSEDEVVGFLMSTADRSAAMIEEMRALAPPPGDEAVVAAIIDQQAALLDRLRTIYPSVPDMGDAEMAELMADLRVQEASADAALVDYGLTACT